MECDTTSTLCSFAAEMARRLEANRHKDGWVDCEFEYLFERLRDEVNELSEAIFSAGNRHRIINEAADVANFAYMIAYRARACDSIELAPE